MKDKQGNPYVPIYFDWLEQTQDLDPEEKGNLIDAVIMYASGQECDHLLNGGAKIAFRFGRNRNKLDQTGTKRNKPEQTGTNRNKYPKRKRRRERKR